MVLTAREIWRKYVTDGVPSSGPWNPKKEEIIPWATRLEQGAPVALSPGDDLADVFASSPGGSSFVLSTSRSVFRKARVSFWRMAQSSSRRSSLWEPIARYPSSLSGRVFRQIGSP